MKKIRKISDYPLLIFLLFIIIAYLPVFLPFFHLKNDLVTQNLPTRYIISESLYSNYFPWWNPYIHFGIPQYGDMNNGFWNPFLWLIAKTLGYNIWTITFEEMLYILIGGWGMYKVMKELGITKEIAILITLCYMSCGYVVGHLQHFCWITGVGFFPFVCLYLLRVNSVPSLKNFILGSLSVFLFVSSTHPGLIIGAIYFLAFAIIFIFLFRKTISGNFYRPNFWLINFIFLLFGSIFSMVVIAADLDVINYISRGSKVTLDQSLLFPTSFQCYLSLLFPLAVNKSSLFATDISMRNLYMGLAPIIAIILSLKYINKKVLLATLAPLLFFILISSGGVFKTVAYNIMPLLGYVRLNGEFSYFVILIILLFSAFVLQLSIRDENFKARVTKYARWFKLFFLVTMTVVLLLILFQHSSILYRHVSPGSFKTAIKNIIDHSTFADLLFLNTLIQFLTIVVLSRKYSHRKAFFVLAGNMVVITWLVLPFTGLGMSSKSEMDRKMIKGPRGLHAQELTSLDQTKFLDSSLRNQLWLLGSYSKKIGYPVEEQYPVQLNTTKKLFEDSALHHYINQQSYIFLSRDTSIRSTTSFDSSYISIIEFGPGHLRIRVNNPGYRFITFLQNDYPWWKTLIDGKKVGHFTGYKTFITLPLVNGKQEIEYRFDPTPLKKILWVNIAVIIAGLISLIAKRRDRPIF